MQSIIVPKLLQLKGKDAIAALNNFISELESEEKELSKNQTLTLKKLAKCMISYIEEEESRKPRKKTDFTKLQSWAIPKNQKP